MILILRIKVICGKRKKKYIQICFLLQVLVCSMTTVWKSSIYIQLKLFIKYLYLSLIVCMFLLVLFMQICSWLVLTVNLLVVIVWQLDLQLSMQSVPIIANVVSLNPAHDEVYSIQQYEIKHVSDLRLFFLGTPVSSTNTTDRHDITEILLKVALNIICLTPLYWCGCSRYAMNKY